MGCILYSTFLVLSTTQSALKHKSTFGCQHKHSYTGGRGQHVRCHLLIGCNKLSYEHPHIQPTIWDSNIVPKETSTCSWSWGMEPFTFRLIEDPSISCPLIRRAMVDPQLLFHVEVFSGKTLIPTIVPDDSSEVQNSECQSSHCYSKISCLFFYQCVGNRTKLLE